jgi:putative transcriptional regulator
MVDILRNKKLATKFQILVEVANSGPQIQQRDIAKKLEVTPQAISDYIAQLIKEGMLIAQGRSKYSVTNEGINWVIKMMRELRTYDTFIEQAITNISVSAAVAHIDISKGQEVGLEMNGGLLYATGNAGSGAKGIATSDARAGEDVGVSNIDGIVTMEVGKVTILKMPSIQGGGSRMVNLNRLEREIKGKELVGGIGIEALVTLKKYASQPIYAYGVKDAAIEAARSGLSPLIVSVDTEISDLIRRLDEQGIDYDIIELKKDKSRADT